MTFLGYLYLSIVAMTSRVRVVAQDPDAILGLREGRKAVYTFWFEHVFFFAYFFGSKKVPMLMTPQGKTDLITGVTIAMGSPAAIGSLEGGGRHALVQLLDQLKAGRPVALSADGSRGPARKCKVGPIMLAQESSSLILPICWKAWLKFKLPRKGGSIAIPLPFNRIEVRVGAPVAVGKHYEFNELDLLKAHLSMALDKLESKS